jgi:hypothetical protein
VSDGVISRLRNLYLSNLPGPIDSFLIHLGIVMIESRVSQSLVSS